MIPTDVLDELYGVDPDQFVSTRTGLARTAREQGDRDLATAIGELRKPTVAAWAVNLLVRERPAEVDRLLDLGRRMRDAQSRLDVDALRSLRSERETALEGFTRAARFVADARGQGLSVAAASDVRSTGVAALADEAAADALAGGSLVRTLEYAGFGEVDVSDAVAAPGASRGARRSGGEEDLDADPSSTPAADAATTATPEAESARRRRLARLEEELAEADRELARASLVEAETERVSAKAARRAEELTRLLDAATAEATASAEAAAEARRDREAAAAAYEQAQGRLASARVT